jgi:hypothetical protein
LQALGEPPPAALDPDSALLAVIDELPGPQGRPWASRAPARQIARVFIAAAGNGAAAAGNAKETPRA